METRLSGSPSGSVSLARTLKVTGVSSLVLAKSLPGTGGLLGGGGGGGGAPGRIVSDQALSVPFAKPQFSTHSCHWPRAFRPRKSDSRESGRKEPANGGVPALMAVAASSSNVVSRKSAPAPLNRLRNT